MALLELVARLLHALVVPVAHLELVDVTEVRRALVEELQELVLGPNPGDLEGGGQSLLAGDVEDFLPLGAVHIPPQLVGRMEADLVEARLAQPTHVLAAARDPRVEVRVVVLAELVFQQAQIPTGAVEHFLGLPARDRGAKRVHQLRLADDVLVVLDGALVGVHLLDVLPVLAERTVETVTLVTVPIHEEDHLSPFRALLAAL